MANAESCFRMICSITARLALVHSIVLRSPSSIDTSAENPSSRRASPGCRNACPELSHGRFGRRSSSVLFPVISLILVARSACWFPCHWRCYRHRPACHPPRRRSGRWPRPRRNEVARGHAAILQRQGHPLERLVDEGRRDVAPHRGGRAAPAARAQDFPDRTRSGTRAHRRQLMLLVIIDG